jgi:hypothetical protein
MSTIANRALFWIPRALSIAFIAFVSLFAALIMHLIPSFILLAVLILAWRWEWIGAALFAVAGLLYVWWVVTMSRPVSPAMRVSWIVTIAFPAFLIAGLWLANWLKRSKPRSPANH